MACLASLFDKLLVNVHRGAKYVGMGDKNNLVESFCQVLHSSLCYFMADKAQQFQTVVLKSVRT